jgi:hypothetical protein
LLILDGHDNHVTLKTIEHAQELGLDMITLPSHTSYISQPLNVSCFKPLKTTLRKVRDATMFRSNQMEPCYKITLVGRVDYAID